MPHVKQVLEIVVLPGALYNSRSLARKANTAELTVVGVIPPTFKFPPSFSAKVTGSEETVINADNHGPLC
ncbi:MAG: hypothetical protein DMF74_09825 [Acidobacteria bacterium]|nr:MAG: hypothetical protein DMF74_09825 [Acidobacteriota bacterium]